MILWSAQPKEVLRLLKSGKSFRCDGRKATCLRTKNMGPYAPGGWDSSFHEPYKWMVKQMKKRGIQKDNRFPVWGWYKYHSPNPGCRVPPINGTYGLKSWAKGQYRLKLRIPDEYVLLSDYDQWHEPLNNMFCGHSDHICRMITLEANKTWPQEKIDRLKHKSWEKIFDLDLDNLEKNQGVQACFPSIEPEYLVKAEKI